jgi:hypothetical protein
VTWNPSHVPFLLLLLAACSPPAASPPPQPAAAPEAPTSRVAIPPTVRANLGITFAKVEVRRVEQTLRVPGAFELRPLARHEYRMALPGTVELLVDQYEAVEPGRPLFRFRSPQWPELLHEVLAGEQAIDLARAEIAVAEAAASEARRRLELARERVAVLAQADFKRADLETQAAELEASLPRLEAEVRLGETRLANARRTREHALHRAAAATGIPEADLLAEDGDGAPRYTAIDWIEVAAKERGVVETLAVTDGAFAEPPAMVLSTVNPELLRFRALALQADVQRIAGAAEARIVPPQGAGVPLGDAVDAALTLGLEASPVDRTLSLLATPEHLLPWMRAGVSAFLEIVVDATAAPALAVPCSAVVQDGLTHVLFRRDPSDPNQAIRVEADLGTSDGRWIVVQSGLMRGDEVVLGGVYELKLATAQQKGAQQGGHFHADGAFHDQH